MALRSVNYGHIDGKKPMDFPSLISFRMYISADFNALFYSLHRKRKAGKQKSGKAGNRESGKAILPPNVTGEIGFCLENYLWPSEWAGWH